MHARSFLERSPDQITLKYTLITSELPLVVSGRSAGLSSAVGGRHVGDIWTV